MQRRFVSDVSHELRTPLTTVRMAGDVLHDARAGFDPATSRAAELLQTELDRFETLLVDLLEISRFDAGAAVLDARRREPRRRRAPGRRAHPPLAEQRGVELEVRAPDHPCLAEADVRRVERIVRNLVTNAIDHAVDRATRPRPPGGGPGRPRDDQAAAIAVRDHGVGLRPGESAMVFNRFWRADPARARTSGGTGLGPVDLPGGHPPARRLAAGLGPAGRGCAVPAHPAAAGRRRCCARARCRWSRATPGAGRMSRRTAGLAMAAWRACLLAGCVRPAHEGPVVETETSGRGLRPMR